MPARQPSASRPSPLVVAEPQVQPPAQRGEGAAEDSSGAGAGGAAKQYKAHASKFGPASTWLEGCVDVSASLGQVVGLAPAVCPCTSAVS